MTADSKHTGTGNELSGKKPPEIRLVCRVNIQDMRALYKDAGWWQPAYDAESGFLTRIPKGSALFAGAFLGDRMIGMGRALSDLCSDGYIQDIAVLTPFRGQGIGRQIVLFLARELQKKGVDWIGLIAEPGTRSFYENMGFEPLKGFVPMKLKV